jgi:hypothetical protein
VRGTGFRHRLGGSRRDDSVARELIASRSGAWARGDDKKWENHFAMFALFAADYDFSRKHQTITTTPAVAAGVASEPWSLEKLLGECAKVVAA